jgi:23S rRNA (pseudouridine1915-N3)-methyltransferase
MLKEEAKLILGKISGHIFVLDIDAKQMTSEEFSKHIDEIKFTGKDLCFVIGSSYGLADTVKSMASEKLSFSDMTFPHQLMRIILLEQIYRAFCISNNITYHK